VALALRILNENDFTWAKTVDSAVAGFKLHKTTEHDAEEPLRAGYAGPPPGYLPAP
jgi:hypothetical protein